jgi:6-pyruvoyltetrahydropterin/6-carboxytetrahydropterin synthase
MIAHSFVGEVFGPAQQMHGATYVVDAEFQRVDLDDDGLIVDIGLAHVAVAAVLKQINFKNLDEVEMFKGKNTTTEFLAHWAWTQLAQRASAGELGEPGLFGICVTLRESDVAWASYEAPLA